jgi:hypothetical protein
MSGGSPSQSSSFQTQQTTSTTEPSPEIQGRLKQGLGGFDTWYAAHPNAPDLYPGRMVADPSQATQSGWQTFAQLGANGLGYGIDPASRALAYQTLSGQFLDPGKNPYLQNYLKAGFDQQNQSFNDVTLPALRSNFEAMGRNSGGADVGVVMRAAKDLGTAQANAAAGAEAGAYNSERNLQQQTQQLLPSFQNMDLARAGALEHAGQGIDAYSQAKINEAAGRWNYQQNAQRDYISDMLQRYLAGYPGGRTTGSGTSSTYQTAMAGQRGVSPMDILNLGVKALSLPIPSDARLKTDIAPVGQLHDGQTVYAYRFKGEPRTQIGLLAQEVEQEHPEAVALHPAGFKMVDYRRATRSARRMPQGGLL